MDLELINVGNYVNDGSGDDLRTAFIKVNNNFDELNLRGGQNNTGVNVGTGVGVFREKIGVDLYFKSIQAGDGIQISQNGNSLTASTITITNTGAIAVSDTAPSQPLTGKLWFDTQSGRMYIYYDTVWVDANPSPRAYKLVDDPNPKLGANLDLNGKNIFGTGNINANVNGTFTGVSTGTHNGLVYGIDVRELDNAINNFDFGLISIPIPRTFSQWILAQYDFDLGTATNPASVDIDIGPIV